MEKSELGAIIRAGNKEVLADQLAEASRQAGVERLKQAMREAHVRASSLANQLLDRYGVAMESRLQDTIHQPPEYYRLTPLIPIGEVDPGNAKGFTHGFIRVRARYKAVAQYPIVDRP